MYTARMNQKLIFALLVIFSFKSFAWDNASEEGLKKTQDLLRSKQQREEYIKKNPQAAEANQKAFDVGGDTKTQDQIYKISADVFSKVAKDSNGDPEKQKIMLDQALRNPETFFNNMTPEQRKQIEDLAKQIDVKNSEVMPKN